MERWTHLSSHTLVCVSACGCRSLSRPPLIILSLTPSLSLFRKSFLQTYAHTYIHTRLPRVSDDQTHVCVHKHTHEHAREAVEGERETKRNQIHGLFRSVCACMRLCRCVWMQSVSTNAHIYFFLLPFSLSLSRFLPFPAQTSLFLSFPSVVKRVASSVCSRMETSDPR